ncbi:MAG: bifunctional glutamate N-acetyltransferase/amino-acid acetyltransferase ArgJ [Pseudomonadota bacterium]
MTAPGFPSPFTPKQPPSPLPVDGVRLATAEAGIKHAGRRDVLLMAFGKGTVVAGTLTRSACPSAAVDWCKERLSDGAQGGEARALLVNSGNANAFTGMKGREATARSAEYVQRALGVRSGEILLASTGVIGEPLPAEKFAGVADSLVASLSDAGDAWVAAAEAIMTTDTFPKALSREVAIGSESITLTGIAKGAGMIAPDMATMLAFIVTDAAISQSLLDTMIKRSVAKSFNAITIDSDTSTSDTVLLFATGKRLSSVPLQAADDPRIEQFSDALDQLCLDLAHLIVRDGEGLSKFITVQVTGASSDASADRVARSIANSPLVKTAFAGEDANWGRVVMAVGKAGEPADRDKLTIWFGCVRVAVGGARDPDYREEDAANVMRQPDITLRVDMGIGSGSATVWTCDLTKDYVAINGDYRT